MKDPDTAELRDRDVFHRLLDKNATLLSPKGIRCYTHTHTHTHTHTLTYCYLLITVSLGSTNNTWVYTHS